MPNASSPRTGTERPAPSRSSGCPSTPPSLTWSGGIPSEVLAWCQQEALFSPGDQVLCAVSGGKDSMVLLDLLLELLPQLGITVRAAHFHHGLRGAEADRDADFVRDYCAGRGVPFVCGHGDAAAEAARTGQSLEQAARALRYAFLQEAADGCPIATAHTADDTLETVLINLSRGTGLRGLGGIPPKRDNIVRPILCLDRRQVAQWLEARQLPHVEDSSNQSRAHLRNRLRQDVLPPLLALDPALPKTLAAEAALLRADADYLDRQAEALLDQAQRPDGLDIRLFQDAPEPVASRMVLLWLRRGGVPDPGRVQVRAVRQLAASSDGSASADLPGGFTVQRTYDRLTLRPSGEAAISPDAPQLLPVPGRLSWGGWRIEAALLPQWDGSQEAGPNVWLLRAPDGPVTVRARRTGDVLDLPGGHRSLKKLMIDKKIPAAVRDALPVLCLGDQVLAALKVGVSAAYAPIPGKCTLRVQIQSIQARPTETRKCSGL